LSANYVLDISGGQDANNANVLIWKRKSPVAANQSFYFVSTAPPQNLTSDVTIQDGIYTIQDTLSPARVVDVQGASTALDAPALIWDAHSAQNQRFYLKRGADGLYSIYALHSGYVLAAKRGNILATTAVVQTALDETSLSQRWAIRDAGSGTYTFTNAQSGLVLDVTGANPAAGSALVLYHANNNANQRFSLKAASPVLTAGTYTITPQASPAKRVDMEGASTTAGTRAIVWTANNNQNQKFQVIKNADNSYSFASLVSGRYLTDVSGAITQQDISASTQPKDSQKWRLVEVFGGLVIQNVASARYLNTNGSTLTTTAKTIASPSSQPASYLFSFTSAPVIAEGYYVVSTKAATNLVLDVNGASTANNANVQLWTANGGNNQIWKVSLAANDTATFTCAPSAKLLDVAGAQATSATNVLQYASHGKTNQKWRIVPSGDGGYIIQSMLGNSLVLGAASGGTTKGANVAVYTAAAAPGAASQTWGFKATTYTPPSSKYSGTYADVNLSTQRMFFVKDSALILQCDVVTGKPSTPTPTGTFYVSRKQSPSVLVGADYRAPVSYWMQFTAGGVGFHDANWQSAFGGNRYRIGYGSHGCVNMPSWAAAQLYSHISVGTRVYVHW
jgi:lipoprotein-anchoring transpeptidase ErfK/SrfK